MNIPDKILDDMLVRFPYGCMTNFQWDLCSFLKVLSDTEKIMSRFVEVDKKTEPSNIWKIS